jgi:KaiC/GvpD/RAD55 family RecA-like ATPase
MQDLEKMAVKLLETARKLPPGPERLALLKQIGTFRTKLAATAARRKQLNQLSRAASEEDALASKGPS